MTPARDRNRTTADRRRARGEVALALAVGFASTLSFAFHGIASRLLSVPDYGAMAAILALMTAASVPIGAVQTALTRSAANELSLGRVPSGRRVLVQALPMAVVLVGATTATAPVTVSVLRLPSVLPLVLAGVWLGVVALEAVGKALLIAATEHRPVAVSLLLGALVRIAAVVVATRIAGLTAAIAASVIGELATMGVLTHQAARRGLLQRNGNDINIMIPDAGRALSAQVSLWLLAALAVLLGRRTLPLAGSGSFAAMATAAASCVFLPQAVATIVFPRFVADGSLRLLLRATGLAAGVGALCAGVLCADPKDLFRLMFGPSYHPDRLVFALLCANFVMLGCLTVLLQYLVARRHAGVVSVWAALIVEAVLGATFGATPLHLAVALVVPSAVVAAVVAVRAVASRRGMPLVAALVRPFAGRATEGGGAPGAGATHHEGTDGVGTTADELGLWAAAEVGLSMVVPNYNGGSQLRPCVQELCAALDRTEHSFEVIVVDDGSTDGSTDGLEHVHGAVRVIRKARNDGKGEALRRGFALARGELIGFIDGDGDIAPTVVLDLVDRLEHTAAWVAVASKNVPGANVAVSASRRAMSAVYRLFVHWIFDLEISDTQCGCKVFRREYMASALALTRERGFALDLELLSVGSRLGMREAAEVPVILQRGAVGTISRASVMRMIGDTVRIRRRLPQRRWDPLLLAAPAPVGGELSSPLLP